MYGGPYIWYCGKWLKSQSNLYPGSQVPLSCSRVSCSPTTHHTTAPSSPVNTAVSVTRTLRRRYLAPSKMSSETWPTYNKKPLQFNSSSTPNPLLYNSYSSLLQLQLHSTSTPITLLYNSYYTSPQLQFHSSPSSEYTPLIQNRQQPQTYITQ